jgi:hypothetical protein
MNWTNFGTAYRSPSTEKVRLNGGCLMLSEGYINVGSKFRKNGNGGFKNRNVAETFRFPSAREFKRSHPMGS